MLTAKERAPITPTAEDAKVAKKIVCVLRDLLVDTDRLVETKRVERVPVREGFEISLNGSPPLPIPEAALKGLYQILSSFAQGSAVAVIPVDKELTTQQAADVIGVSRQFLVEQLEGGELPFHKVGTHRRVKLSDLLEYRQNMKTKRRAALRKMTDINQELGLDF